VTRGASGKRLKTTAHLRRLVSVGSCAARKALSLALAAVLLLGSTISAPAAALNSNFFTVNLQANAKESLSVTAAPALVNFLLLPAGGISNGNVPVSIHTSWVLQAGRTRVRLYIYFASAPAALTDGAGTNIPSSRVLGSVNGGAFRTITRNSPFGAARSLRLFNQVITNANLNGARTDSLAMQINTTALLLPAGIYTGLLIIQARAI
jgi:hypothetical protein